MEYGLHLTDIGPLPADPREVCGLPWRAVLPPGPLRALYFGSEFCIDLLPGSSVAEGYCAHARTSGVEATLLTPLVTSQGLERIETLLTVLDRLEQPPSVVFNDWGVAMLLQEEFPRFPRRAGRLLNRALRDPRLAAEPAAAANITGDRGDRLRKLLGRCGAVAVETDPDLEGGYFSEAISGLQRTLYLPYTFAASSRNCLEKAEQTGNPDRAFTKGLGTACDAACAGQWRQVQRHDTAQPLWRQGNTLMYEVPLHRARPYLAHADRVVLFAGPGP